MNEEDLPTTSGVYLLHYCQPIGNKEKTRGSAQHYMGYADNIRRRVGEHRRGSDAHLTRAFRNAAIDFVVAAIWTGESRTDERRRKDNKKHARYCPLCRARRKEQKKL
jgi:predicted GIY-YIG superfamily endonuclease